MDTVADVLSVTKAARRFVHSSRLLMRQRYKPLSCIQTQRRAMKLLPGSLSFCHAQSDRERNNEEGGVFRTGGC